MLILKGYDIKCGYMGWTGDRYILFPTFKEYEEYMEELQDDEI